MLSMLDNFNQKEQSNPNKRKINSVKSITSTVWKHLINYIKYKNSENIDQFLGASNAASSIRRRYRADDLTQDDIDSLIEKGFDFDEQKRGRSKKHKSKSIIVIDGDEDNEVSQEYQPESSYCDIGFSESESESGSYHDFECKKKNETNQMLIRMVKKYLPNIQNVLTLDGTECRTSYAFVESQLVSPNQIYVPQYNDKEYELMKDSKMCRVFNVPLNGLLYKLEDEDNEAFHSINVFYGDYMGGVTGNRSIYLFPLEDIQRLLQRSHQKRIIIATTFTQRENKQKFSHRKNMGEQIEEDYLKPLFLSCGWRIVDSDRKSYMRTRGSPMYFSVFVLDKDLSITQKEIDDVEFACEKTNDGKLIYLGYSDFV
jgi:hypothetical protein